MFHKTLEILKEREAEAEFNEKLWNEFLSSFKKNTEEAFSMTTDNVNQPNHYTHGDIEVIDYIKDKLTAEQFEGYCIGNVLKYVSRYRLKGGKEDLRKAQVYLGWAIESAGEDEIELPIRPEVSG